MKKHARAGVLISIALIVVALSAGCSAQPPNTSDGEADNQTQDVPVDEAQPAEGAAPSVTMEDVLAPVPGFESVEPTEALSQSVGLKSRSGTGMCCQVVMDGGLTNVYFDSGGRQNGYPITIILWNIGEGGENIATTPGIYWDLGEEPSEVTIGNHAYFKLTDEFGGVSYQGFVGDWYVLASSGGASNAQESELIMTTVLSRIP